jgi:hypothetical protein
MRIRTSPSGALSSTDRGLNSPRPPARDCRPVVGTQNVPTTIPFRRGSSEGAGDRGRPGGQVAPDAHRAAAARARVPEVPGAGGGRAGVAVAAAGRGAALMGHRSGQVGPAGSWAWEGRLRGGPTWTNVEREKSGRVEDEAHRRSVAVRTRRDATATRKEGAR